MIYVLHTDIFTLVELPESPEYSRLHSRVLQLDPDDRIVTTIVTYEEQTRGWLAFAAKSREIRHQITAYSRLKRHLLTYQGFDVLDFNAAAGREMGHLLSLKLRMGAVDLKIAAIVLSENAVLLSRNLKDFRRIPQLRVEDWSRP